MRRRKAFHRVLSGVRVVEMMLCVGILKKCQHLPSSVFLQTRMLTFVFVSMLQVSLDSARSLVSNESLERGGYSWFYPVDPGTRGTRTGYCMRSAARTADVVRNGHGTRSRWSNGGEYLPHLVQAEAIAQPYLNSSCTTRGILYSNKKHSSGNYSGGRASQLFALCKNSEK
jgi:hypothetical protein